MLGYPTWICSMLFHNFNDTRIPQKYFSVNTPWKKMLEFSKFPLTCTVNPKSHKFLIWLGTPNDTLHSCLLLSYDENKPFFFELLILKFSDKRQSLIVRILEECAAPLYDANHHKSFEMDFPDAVISKIKSCQDVTARLWAQYETLWKSTEYQ